MKTTLEMLKDFVRKNYGESELENPCYDLDALADYLDTHNEFGQEIRTWIDEETDLELDRHPQDYNPRYYLTGAGVGAYECEYDEHKAREYVIDNFDITEVLESESVLDKLKEFVKQFIW